jgi:hypothetical protein
MEWVDMAATRSIAIPLHPCTTTTTTTTIASMHHQLAL